MGLGALLFVGPSSEDCPGWGRSLGAAFCTTGDCAMLAARLTTSPHSHLSGLGQSPAGARSGAAHGAALLAYVGVLCTRQRSGGAVAGRRPFPRPRHPSLNPRDRTQRLLDLTPRRATCTFGHVLRCRPGWRRDRELAPAGFAARFSRVEHDPRVRHHPVRARSASGSRHLCPLSRCSLNWRRRQSGRLRQGRARLVSLTTFSSGRMV